MAQNQTIRVIKFTGSNIEEIDSPQMKQMATRIISELDRNRGRKAWLRRKSGRDNNPPKGMVFMEHLKPLVEVQLGQFLQTDRKERKALRRNPKLNKTQSSKEVKKDDDEVIRNNLKNLELNENCKQRKNRQLTLGLKEKIWHDIFAHLSIEELKNFRLVCYDSNKLVEESTEWASNLCFIVDPKMHPSKGLSNLVLYSCPKEVICDDNTLGWPLFRLRGIMCPFSVKDFLPMKDVRESIRYVEIVNCIFTWKDVIDLLKYLPKMEKFSFIYKEDFLIGNNGVLMTLKHDLTDNYDVMRKLKQTKKKLRHANAPTFTKHLKTIHLDAVNIDLTNILLAVLENACESGLEKLEIILSEACMFYLPPECQDYQFSPTKKLRARRIIQNNQRSLKHLRISVTRCRNNSKTLSDLAHTVQWTGVESEPLFKSVLHPPYDKCLKLETLEIEIPPTLLIAAKFAWKTPIFDAKIKIRDWQSYIFNFCRTQPSLKRFVMDNICADGVPDLKQYFSKNPLCNIRISLHLSLTNETVFPSVADSPEQCQSIHTLQEIYLCLREHSVKFENVFHEDIPVLKNLKKFKLWNFKRDLESINWQAIILKFPNLTILHLIDERNRNTDCDYYDNLVKFNDLDFQNVIYYLPKLEQIMIKLNMSQLTDFGLTGISPEASKRMKKENRFKRQIGDVIGHPLSRLSRLEVLEIHGLGDNVTNVTAYLGFRDISALAELYLFSPKFSKLAKKFLKDKFAQRKDFSLAF